MKITLSPECNNNLVAVTAATNFTPSSHFHISMGAAGFVERATKNHFSVKYSKAELNLCDFCMETLGL